MEETLASVPSRANDTGTLCFFLQRKYVWGYRAALGGGTGGSGIIVRAVREKKCEGCSLPGFVCWRP